MAKRVFDILLSSLGLVFLFPLFGLVALLLKLDSQGPVFFIQERIGRHGKPFNLYKFRTMVVNASEVGLPITVGDDPRITGVGRVLRNTKIDELPQLINVIKGNMSLVGPRPELPEYVSLYPDGVREKVLSLRPGITDLASLEFRDESEMLAKCGDPKKVYAEEILPRKIDYYVRYLKEQSLRTDVKIILYTLLVLGGGIGIVKKNPVIQSFKKKNDDC